MSKNLFYSDAMQYNSVLAVAEQRGDSTPEIEGILAEYERAVSQWVHQHGYLSSISDQHDDGDCLPLAANINACLMDISRMNHDYDYIAADDALRSLASLLRPLRDRLVAVYAQQK